MLPRLAILHLRERSLPRGVALSLAAFVVSLRLAGFPNIDNLHHSQWQVVTLVAALGGMVETGRCIRRRWSFYHAGVLVLLYSELMILTVTAFLTFFF
ncbi:MAG TPA: hypothetical protein VMA34_15300 [Terracidiphilus sp.]|nr:hypothetical protein [Terracidiphilus sp.]